MEEEVGVIVDCDPGVDDSMALIFLLSHLRKMKNHKLKGITIVHGNNPSTKILKRNAQLILKYFDFFDVPVVEGSSSPLFHPYTGHAGMLWHGKNGLGDVSLSSLFPFLKEREEEEKEGEEEEKEKEKEEENEAVKFLYETVKREREREERERREIVLICLGPLTNVGKCLLKYGKDFSSFVRVVLMGGCFQTYNPGGNVSPVAEANVHNDPEAADLVFSARWKKRLRIVPMDVTEKTRLSYSFIEQFGKLSNKAGPFVHKIVQFYYKRYEFCEKEGRKKSEEFSEKRESERDKIRYDGPDTEQKETTIPVHDSSAMMGYFHPKVYTWRSLMVRVECKGQWTRGMCVGWGPEREEKGEREERGEKGEEGEEGEWVYCDVAWSVDADEFRRIYLETFREMI